MFQFTTTTVINNPVAATTEDYREWTEGAWRKVDQGYTWDNEAKEWAGPADLPEFRKMIKVTDGPAFTKDGVLAIHYAPFKEAKADKVTFDLSALDETAIYRIVLYIRSRGNADPMYANDFVHKGKPAYVEFNGDMSVDEILEVVQKFGLNMNGEKMYTVKKDGDNLVLTCVNGYQRLHFVALEKWVEDTTLVEGGHFSLKEADGGKVYTEEVESGCEGFGTYEQILKDLRLPTGDNLSYKNANETEMPVLGGKYFQVTVHMCKDLFNYPGGIGVQNPVASVTKHVFFLNGEEGAQAFLADLEEITGVTHSEIPEDAEATTNEGKSDKADMNLEEDTTSNP